MVKVTISMEGGKMGVLEHPEADYFVNTFKGTLDLYNKEDRVYPIVSYAASTWIRVERATD